MQYAYSAADIVIARAGALTISECIFYRLPCILIPYPYAYEHQMHNAQVLKQQGCAIVLADNEILAQTLKTTIQRLLKDSSVAQGMAGGYAFFPRIDANRALVEELFSLN